MMQKTPVHAYQTNTRSHITTALLIDKELKIYTKVTAVTTSNSVIKTYND